MKGNKLAKQRTRKNKKETQSKNQFAIQFDKIIPEKYQVPASLALVVILIAIFFAPAYFGDKTFQSGDIITQHSYENYNEKSEYFLWDPYIFTGMPKFGYAHWYDTMTHLIGQFKNLFTAILSDEYAGHSFWLFLLAFSSFYFMRSKGATIGTSLFASIATSFSVSLISLLFVGHINKLATVAVFPLVLLLVFKHQQKVTFLNALILLIALKYMFSKWHVQIIFYIYFNLESLLF